MLILIGKGLQYSFGYFKVTDMTEEYENQLAEKAQRIRQQFADFLSNVESPLEVYQSSELYFRQRAEFRLWHERDENGDTGEAFYAMFESGKKASAQTLKRTDTLPIASKRINELMPTLLAAAKSEPVLMERLFQVEFLSTLRGDTLVTLIYHKTLDEQWQQEATELAKSLDVHLIGRSRGQKIVVSQDFVTEKLHVLGHNYTYRQIEGGFTQPNAEVCEKMLTWACTVAKETHSAESDLLELYCGNGNFTLPLSRHFRQVLATEVAKTSVNAARHNIAENNCNNIAIARLSAEEFTRAFTKQREFRRLVHDNINVDDYRVNTIFVDPPRAGIDDDTLHLMQKFEHIIYISCNPDTLFNNLQILKKTHNIKRMAMFDQFPYTHHVEMGVWLEKK